jgi:hypothetical protein
MVWRNVMDTSGPTAWHRTYRNGTSKIKQACHRPHDHQAPFQRLESRMQVPRLNPVLVFQMQCSWTLLLRCILCTLRLWCHNTSQHVTTCHHSFWTCYIMLHQGSDGFDALIPWDPWVILESWVAEVEDSCSACQASSRRRHIQWCFS